MVWGSRAWSIYIFTYIYGSIHISRYMYIHICRYTGIFVMWILLNLGSSAQWGSLERETSSQTHSQTFSAWWKTSSQRYYATYSSGGEVIGLGRVYARHETPRTKSRVTRHRRHRTSKSDAEFAPMSFSDGRMYISSSWNGGSENTCIMRVPTVRK